MGKKAQAAAERMATACEKLAEVFAQAHARDRDMGVDEVIRANHALQGMIDKRDESIKALQAELAELAAYNKRLERDREQGGLAPEGSELVIVP
jgi:hypothetical protein